MERLKCAINSSHVAQFTCRCVNPPLYFCLQCLERHTQDSQAHPIHQLNTNERLFRGENLCSCGFPEEEMCLCVFPIVTFCHRCRATHVSHDSANLHTSLPATLKNNFKTEHDLLQAKQRLITLSVAECYLKKNIADIELCERMYKERYVTLKKMTEDYRTAHLEPLTRTKAVLAARLDQDIGSLRSLPLHSEPAEGLSQLVQTYMASHNPEILSLFRYEQVETEVNMSEIVGVYWESRLGVDGQIAPNFAKSELVDDFSDIFSAVDGLLAEENEEKYVAAFMQELSSRRPDKVFSKETVKKQQEEARLHFYHQHYMAALARDQTFASMLSTPSTSAQALILFAQKAGPLHPSLHTKYSNDLLSSLETTLATQQQLEALRNENQTLTVTLGPEIEPPVRRGRGRPRSLHPKVVIKNRPKMGFHLFAHEISTDKSQLPATKEELAVPGTFLKVAGRMWQALSQREREDWKYRAMHGEDEPSKRARGSSVSSSEPKEEGDSSL